MVSYSFVFCFTCLLFVYVIYAILSCVGVGVGPWPPRSILVCPFYKWISGGSRRLGVEVPSRDV